MSISKDGRELVTLEDWETHAGPKSQQQWQDGRTTPEKQAQNARDLRDFVRRISHDEVREVGSGSLHGPFGVPGAPLLNERVPSLFIGKIRCMVQKGSTE
jgi:hypothetical protein